MTITFRFYNDPGLTTETGTLTFEQKSDGSTGPVRKTVYLGSGDANLKIEAESQPSVDPITLNIYDTNPGSGHEVNEVKIALSETELDSATAGASIDLPATIVGGTVNAIEIWAEVEDQTFTAGTSIELGIQTVDVIETGV